MGQGTTGPELHPVGTGDTPMVMPLAAVEYAEEGSLYETVHPLITADGAVIPGRAPFIWPESVPGPRGASQ